MCFTRNYCYFGALCMPSISSTSRCSVVLCVRMILCFESLQLLDVSCSYGSLILFRDSLHSVCSYVASTCMFIHMYVHMLVNPYASLYGVCAVAGSLCLVSILGVNSTSFFFFFCFVVRKISQDVNQVSVP